MTKSGSLILLFSMILGLLSGCAIQPIVPEPEQAQAPRPEKMLITDGTSTQTLEPGDVAYHPIAEALVNLVAGIDALARTFFTAEDFEETFALRPHLEAIYGHDVKLVGKGIEVEASRLIVAFPDGDMMILTRPEAESSWAVYLSGDIALFDTLAETVKTQTGVDLEAMGP